MFGIGWDAWGRDEDAASPGKSGLRGRVNDAKPAEDLEFATDREDSNRVQMEAARLEFETQRAGSKKRDGGDVIRRRKAAKVSIAALQGEVPRMTVAGE